MPRFSVLIHPIHGPLAVLLGACAGSALHAEVAATPTVLTFEDVAPPSFAVHMPDSYDGFRFLNTSWYVMVDAAAPSGAFLALGGAATSIATTGGADFYFDGIDAWSRRAGDANGRFYFFLMHDGVVVYDGRDDPDGRLVFLGSSQRFTANYTGPVDYVAIVFDQGGQDWDHFALDNFSFHGLAAAAAPESSGIALRPGGVALEFRGTPGQPYRIDTCDDLGAANWTQLSVVASDQDGRVLASDAPPAGTTRFYRAVAP